MVRKEITYQLIGGLLCISIAVPLTDSSPLISFYLGGVATTLIGNVVIRATQRITENKPKTIESKLAVESRTRGENTPRFFRNEGPLAIDFEKGYFSEIRHLEGIKNRLMKERRIMIFGPRGSGKSFLLRDLGFKLLEDGYDVFLIELKEESFEVKDIAGFFAERQKAFLLIDDAHLEMDFCEAILMEDLKMRIALTCSYSPEDLALLKESHPKTADLIEEGVETNPEETGKRIISTYLEKKRLQCNSEEEEMLYEFSNDLWILSMALTMFSEEGLLNEEYFHKKIEAHISAKLQKRYEIKNADSIILVIATFYKYGIPIERKFIEKEFIDKKNWIRKIIGKKIDIDELVRLKEILEYRRMLRLTSISIAELYSKTLADSPWLARGIKDELKGDLEMELFRRYILSSPRNLLEIFICLGGHSDKGFEMIGKLIEDQLLAWIISEKLGNESNIKTVSWFLFRIARTDFSGAKKFLESFEAVELLQKAIKLNDITRFHLLLLAISKLSQDKAKRVVQAVSEDQITQLYNNCEKIGFIEPALGIIKSINEDIAFKITSGMDRNCLIERINYEKNLGSIRSFLLSLRKINEDLFLWILNQIETSHLIETINDTNKTGAIASFLGTLRNMDENIAKEICSEIDGDHIAEVIFDSDKAGAVESLIFTINHINSDISDEIIEKIRKILPEKIVSNKLNAPSMEGMITAFFSLKPEIIKSFFEEIGDIGFMKVIETSSSDEIAHLIKTLNSVDPMVRHEFEGILKKARLLSKY